MDNERPLTGHPGLARVLRKCSLQGAAEEQPRKCSMACSSWRPRAPSEASRRAVLYREPTWRTPTRPALRTCTPVRRWRRSAGSTQKDTDASATSPAVEGWAMCAKNANLLTAGSDAGPKWLVGLPGSAMHISAATIVADAALALCWFPARHLRGSASCGDCRRTTDAVVPPRCGGPGGRLRPRIH